MNRKVLKTMIILCYCIVFVCFILRKFFIFDMFDISRTNSTLEKICIFLQENSVLRHIALFPFYLTLNGLYLLSVYKLKWFDNKALVLNIVVLTVVYIVGCFFPQIVVPLYLIQFVVLPIITKPCKQTLIDTIIGLCVVIFFVVGMSYIKGIVFWKDIDLYELCIFAIDVYIVAIIHYLYRANYTLIPNQLRGDSNEISQE